LRPTFDTSQNVPLGGALFGNFIELSFGICNLFGKCLFAKAVNIRESLDVALTPF
jgi:hypothetical protein